MGRKTLRSNFRVEVYPRPLGDYGYAFISGQTQSEEDWIKDCEAIARDIERHVNGLPTMGRKTEIVWDNEHLCEHCGYPWTEAFNAKHNGGCCEEDAKVMEAEADDPR